jgi:hypothetical protein
MAKFQMSQSNVRHLERSRFLQAKRKISRGSAAVGLCEIPRPAGEGAGLRNDAVMAAENSN